MADAQITARLAPVVKARFEEYAKSLGLKASELAKLLIVRERYQRRLAKLNKNRKLPEKARRSPGSGGRLPTITAHLSSIKQVEEFDEYVHECGFNRSSASAYIFEAEVRERWLEKALADR